MKSKKVVFFATIEDLVAELLYYDRKEDEELSVSDVESLFKSGEVTIDEVTYWFQLQLTKGLRNI